MSKFLKYINIMAVATEMKYTKSSADIAELFFEAAFSLIYLWLGYSALEHLLQWAVRKRARFFWDIFRYRIEKTGIESWH